MKTNEAQHGATLPEGRVHKMVVRTSKQDSVFLYNVLEASEGLAAYSTVNYQIGDRHRDVELLIPLKLLKNVKDLMTFLKNTVQIISEELD